MVSYPKNQIFAFYTVIVVLLSVLGFFQGEKILKLDKHKGAAAGAMMGLVISVILWYSYGKEHSY